MVGAVCRCLHTRVLGVLEFCSHPALCIGGHHDGQQIAKKGVGKIRHLVGKVEYTASGKIKVVHMPTHFNLSDVGTKRQEQRLYILYCIGMVDGKDNDAVGEAEYKETEKQQEVGKKIKAMAEGPWQ